MNVSHIQVEYQVKGFVNITGCKPVTNQPGASPLVIKIPIDNARLKAWNKTWKTFLRDIIVSPFRVREVRLSDTQGVALPARLCHSGRVGRVKITAH